MRVIIPQVIYRNFSAQYWPDFFSNLLKANDYHKQNSDELKIENIW